MEEALRVVLLSRDEDPGAQDLLRLLRGAGLRVVETRSGDEIGQDLQGRVDLIILAAPAGEANRDALVRRLKAEPALSGVPVLSLVESTRPEPHPDLFDALGDAVALLDHSGSIVRCNHAMAWLLGLTVETVVGRDLFSLAAGLTMRRGDLPGLKRREVVEWPRGERLYRVTAAPVHGGGIGGGDSSEGYVLVVATDITETRLLSERAAESTAATLAAESRIEQLEHDARLLQRFNAEAEARGTQIPDSTEPLRTVQPDAYRDLVLEYEGLLDRVMDRLTYRISDPLSVPLRALAGRLGALGAGPRDVVELHGTALRHKTVGTTSTHARALADEGRLLVLELMGHLVSYYRRQGKSQQGDSGSDGSQRNAEGCTYEKGS